MGQEDNQRYKMVAVSDNYSVNMCGIEDSWHIPDWEWRFTSFSVSDNNFTVKVCNRRIFTFYVTSVLAPLWGAGLLGIMSLFCPPLDFADRMGNIAGMFLTLLALLYVVGDSLPKRSSLNAVDRMVLFTVTLFIFVTLISLGTYMIAVHVDNGEIQEEDVPALVGSGSERYWGGAAIVIFGVAMVVFVVAAKRKANGAFRTMCLEAASLATNKSLPKGVWTVEALIGESGPRTRTGEYARLP